MTQERLSMRKTREVLRLKHEHHLTAREIARSCGIAPSTVVTYLARAAEAGLTWPLPADLTDEALETRLFHRPLEELAVRPRPLPDYAAIDEELRRHRRLNLTLDLLWQEYKEQHPDGYQYTQFVAHYHRWRQKREVCLRQTHRYGEKVFVDFTDGLPVTDPKTGAPIPTHLFVAVWGASNYTYAEACASQELPAWIGAHVRAFAYFGVVPQIVVPDNLRSGVSRACWYDPDINPTYAEMAAHYGLAILPARPRRPRDKAKVEGGVLITQRWILSVLRRRLFISTAEMNAAIRGQLERLNTRPLRQIQRSRRDLFEAWDRPVAQALPAESYQFGAWKKATVNIDYHIAVGQHYYSVPYRLVRETVEVRVSATTIEVFHKGQRVAAHPRSRVPHQHTTLREHMPIAHQRYKEWSPSRIVAWADQTGPATAKVVERILASRAHPEQGYRACLGVLRLGQQFSPERLEAASRRALHFNSCSYKGLRNILTAGLDKEAPQEPAAQLAVHDNLRGAEYYTPNSQGE